MNISETVLDEVLNHFDISALEIKSKRRPERIAWPRQIAMHLAIRCGVSSVEAAKFYGREHATALYASETVANRMDTEKNVKILVEQMEKRILQKLAPEAMGQIG